MCAFSHFSMTAVKEINRMETNEEYLVWYIGRFVTSYDNMSLNFQTHDWSFSRCIDVVSGRDRNVTKQRVKGELVTIPVGWWIHSTAEVSYSGYVLSSQQLKNSPKQPWKADNITPADVTCGLTVPKEAWNEAGKHFGPITCWRQIFRLLSYSQLAAQSHTSTVKLFFY